MQARSSRLAALTVAVFVAAMALVAIVPSASAATGAGVRAADAQTCQKPPPRNDDTIHFTGCLLDQREKPPTPVPDVDDHRRGRVRQGRRQRHQRRDGHLRHRRCPGRRSTTSARRTRSRSTPTRCPRAPRCATRSRSSLDRHAQPRRRHLRHLPDRQRQQRLDRQGRPGPAARWSAASCSRCCWHGRTRAVDDLRHHRADQLRPRRADHLRRAGRLRRWTGCRGRSRSAARTSPSLVAVIVAFIASGVLRLAQRQGPVAAAAHARHRPGRDDDRDHRPVDLPAQHLPVLRRRAATTSYSQYSSPQPVPLGPDADHADGHLRRAALAGRAGRRSSSRCSAPGSARRPARSPTTRRWPPPPASTWTG